MASEHVNAYPTPEQHERWQQEAEQRGYDGVTSRFICEMVEAGLKKFAVEVEPDETNRELRRQRNDLKRELDDARDRIDALERELHHGEREAILAYVDEHPGASFDDIMQHVANTLPERVNRHLDELEGDELRRRTGGYYRVRDAPEEDG